MTQHGAARSKSRGSCGRATGVHRYGGSLLPNACLARNPPTCCKHFEAVLAFHRFYFDLGGIRGRHLTTMASPRVRLLGDVAIVAYVRLVQKVGPDGAPVTAASAETRVWQRQNGQWKHVHFHRSPLA